MAWKSNLERQLEDLPENDPVNVQSHEIRTESTSCKASTMIALLLGLASEDLRTTVLPQRSGITTARAARTTAAFHGAIAKLKH